MLRSSLISNAAIFISIALFAGACKPRTAASSLAGTTTKGGRNCNCPQICPKMKTDEESNKKAFADEAGAIVGIKATSEGDLKATAADVTLAFDLDTAEGVKGTIGKLPPDLQDAFVTRAIDTMNDGIADGETKVAILAEVKKTADIIEPVAKVGENLGRVYSVIADTTFTEQVVSNKTPAQATEETIKALQDSPRFAEVGSDAATMRPLANTLAALAGAMPKTAANDEAIKSLEGLREQVAASDQSIKKASTVVRDAYRVIASAGNDANKSLDEIKKLSSQGLKGAKEIVDEAGQRKMTHEELINRLQNVMNETHGAPSPAFLAHVYKVQTDSAKSNRVPVK